MTCQNWSVRTQKNIEQTNKNYENEAVIIPQQRKAQSGYFTDEFYQTCKELMPVLLNYSKDLK
jgi:hypothetical protein